MHEHLINLRHNFIAHRGETDHEQAIAYMRTSKLVGNNDKGIFVRSLRATAPNPDKLQPYSKLFFHVFKIVEAKFNAECDKLQKHLDNKSSQEMKEYLIK